MAASAQGNDCASAVPLPTGATCINTLGSNVGHTFSNPIPAPSCGAFDLDNTDSWFSITVPASGDLNIEVSSGGVGQPTDWAMQSYTGSCGALVALACDDDGGPGLFPLLQLTGLTPGETVYLAVWEWGTTGSAVGSFNICAIAPPSACDLFPPLTAIAGATIEICEGEDAQLSILAEGGFVAPSYFAARFFGSANYSTGNLLDIATDAFCGASSNVFGMDYAGDGGTLYGIDNAGQLITIDPVTCAETVVGPTPSQGGQTWSGLAWNAANNTMYATSLAIGNTTLYSINLATGAPTVIGTSGQSSILVSN